MKSLWPLFGISNQMLAAVALVLGTVVLVKMQRTKYIWVTVIPAAWLLLCTTRALGLKLFSSNPQMEGFFFMAQQYKEKIAAGGELTAQQIANMNHIVVNNYTNAGLSILFWWWCIASSSTASKPGSMSATIRCVPTKRLRMCRYRKAA